MYYYKDVRSGRVERSYDMSDDKKLEGLRNQRVRLTMRLERASSNAERDSIKRQLGGVVREIRDTEASGTEGQS